LNHARVVRACIIQACVVQAHFFVIWVIFGEFMPLW